ncbi:hypothetical protein BD311DRAFT_863953 [Dichomitus squalens]|uniref:SET domain-containing protein n=1 Tax=Dichomitus squalens TaxID=114155 RepID=A0A4V2K0Y4_9APHY|nr:hypothetical protein BD311DRAFT_863953 [Dichomitus squalens]
MSMHNATTASASSTTPPGPLLHIRTDPYAGRKYHATSPLPENADLLGSCAPFSYTIWKRFRNEVCAECWRYDRGRRSFLTRRDDEGLGEHVPPDASTGTQNVRQNAPRGPKPTSTTGAGLWFCDAACQRSWIAREGADAVGLLRQLEGARRKARPKPQPQPVPRGDAERELTQETVDRAWDAVRERERSPKEVRKWRDIQLDDYETDMARYVLLAFLRYHRERCERHADEVQSPPLTGRPPYSCTLGRLPSYQSGVRPDGLLDTNPIEAKEGYEQGSEWSTFASLQSNELSLLRACPEILEHQTRVYQLLRGRFGRSSVAADSVPAPSRRRPLSASSPPKLPGSTADVGGPREKPAGGDSATENGTPELGDIITVAGVRTALGIDPGNSFGVWEVPLMDESECLGFAVYPIASFFNHHCSPNVRKEREGRTLRFVTTRTVEEGEELCISYGHVEGMDWATRQQELLEGWYFSCRCSRCKSEDPRGAQT